jgi:hypothetical protein
MSFLTFQRDYSRAARRKTDVQQVRSARWGDVLGAISWYSPWRQYALQPRAGTIWNPDCLREVADKCAAMTKEHRERRT